MNNLERQFSRRSFLKGSGALALGAVAIACGEKVKEPIATPSGGVLGESVEPTPTLLASEPTQIHQEGQIVPRETENARLNLGNIEVSVLGWEVLEANKLVSNSYQLDQNKYKVVALQFAVKNIQEKQINTQLLADSTFYNTMLVADDGEVVGHNFFISYLRAGGGLINKPYFTDSAGRLRPTTDFTDSYQYQIQEGFSLPFGTLIFVHKDKWEDNLGFGIVPVQEGLPNPNKYVLSGNIASADYASTVKIGQTAPAEPFLPGHIRVGNPQSDFLRFNYEDIGYRTFRLNRVFNRQEGSEEKQILQFKVEVDPVSRFGFNTPNSDLNIGTYLADGRFMVATDISQSKTSPGQVGEFEATISGRVVDLNLKKDVSAKVPLEDSITVFSYGKPTAAWKTPQETNEFGAL